MKFLQLTDSHDSLVIIGINHICMVRTEAFSDPTGDHTVVHTLKGSSIVKESTEEIAEMISKS